MSEQKQWTEEEILAMEFDSLEELQAFHSKPEIKQVMDSMQSGVYVREIKSAFEEEDEAPSQSKKKEINENKRKHMINLMFG